MKSPLVLIYAAAISASLLCSSAIGRTSNAVNSDPANSRIALNAPASAHAHSKAATPQVAGSLHGLKGAVVSEMRATKAFVKESVVKDPVADKGLMLLAGVGMIVLQLRRKHKSLPQRQIAPYA